MGKNKVRKRRTLMKQFLHSYIMILVCSIVTAVIIINILYMAFHIINDKGTFKQNSQELSEIIEFVNQYGDSIQDDAIRKQLDALAQSNNIKYFVKDNDNNIFIGHNLHNQSSVQVPIIDKTSGKIKYLFIMTYYSTNTWIILSCLDLGVPFLCFLIYTYIFALRLSKKLKKPIKELVSAANKIKERNLDFYIDCDDQDNEIGDLVLALESMRCELKDSLIKQWELEQERKDMVSSITHDIRTPLAIIQGHVEGLQDGIKDNPEKLNIYLSIIEANVNRTKNLIDDMNTLVEIDNEGFSIQLSSVVLSEFLENKLSEVQVLADHKEIKIKLTINDHREDKVALCLDANRLSQIIDNLVSNSIRFTPEGGQISIITEIWAKKVQFQIYDTGAGFSEKDRANLFKKFYKGDYSRSMDKGNSGLGLYIVKSIVEKHGGEINAYNMENGGACIVFSLETKYS